MAKWQHRESKLNKRRTIKEQHKFFRETKPEKGKNNKLIMKEKQLEQEKQNEDDGEVFT